MDNQQPPIEPGVPTPRHIPKSLAIGILIVIMIIITVGLYFNLTTMKSPQQTHVSSPPPTSVSPTTDPTVNWQTYTDTKHGYTIKYPPEFTITSYYGSTPHPHLQDFPEGITLENKNQSMTIAAGTLSDYYKYQPLDKIVGTGSLINACYEDTPANEETVTTNSRQSGLKVAYWTQKGCQGAKKRILSSSHVFFDKRIGANIIYEITATGMDDNFDQIISTFKVTKK